jgi:hypothetical protein
VHSLQELNYLHIDGGHSMYNAAEDVARLTPRETSAASAGCRDAPQAFQHVRA